MTAIERLRELEKKIRREAMAPMDADGCSAIECADELSTLIAELGQEVGAVKPAECADGCPPYQVCDYCQASAGAPDAAHVVAQPMNPTVELDAAVTDVPADALSRRTLHHCLSQLLDTVEAAITSGDWKVDGACDPSIDIKFSRRALGRKDAAMRQEVGE